MSPPDDVARLFRRLRGGQERHARGQPILIGTASIETSEQVAELLEEQGLMDGDNFLSAFMFGMVPYSSGRRYSAPGGWL